MTSSLLSRQFPELRAHAELDAEARAETILHAARAEADALRRAAEEEYETWKAQALREGEELALARTEAAYLLAMQAEERALAELKRAAVPLVVKAAEKLARHVFEAEPERLVSVIEEAAQELRLAKELRVEVHPADLALARSVSLGARRVSLSENPSLARGECLVTSEIGRVDGRFAAQLHSLLQGSARGASGGPQ